MDDSEISLGLPKAQAARVAAAFPPSLRSDLERVVTRLPAGDLPPTEHSIGPVTIRGEAIHIPQRVYFPEPGADLGADFSVNAQRILWCVYTRHNDGRIREKYAAKLLDAIEIWTAPFVIQLAGEYVVEIIESIESKMGNRVAPELREFARENPEFLALTKQRTVSYWDCYYRSEYPQKENYPGYRLVSALE